MFIVLDCSSSNTKGKRKIESKRKVVGDLVYCGTPYSPWTGPTAEHPTHHRPEPPRHTLLTMDLPHVKNPTESMEEDPKKISKEGTSTQHIYSKTFRSFVYFVWF